MHENNVSNQGFSGMYYFYLDPDAYRVIIVLVIMIIKQAMHAFLF